MSKAYLYVAIAKIWEDIKGLMAAGKSFAVCGEDVGTAPSAIFGISSSW